MLDLDKQDRPAKPDRSRRSVLHIILTLILIGMVGLAGLRLFVTTQQDGPGNTTQTNISAAAQNSQAGTAPDKTRDSPLELAEKTGSGQKPSDSKTDDIEPDEALDEALDEDKAVLAISGAVLDDSGTLLPDILVMARPTPSSEINQEATLTTKGALGQVTDRLGAFTFDNLAEGEYELLVAENEQHYPATLRVRAGVANAELVLQRIRSILVYGFITDDAGNPLEGVRVRNLGVGPYVRSDVSGAYTIQTGPGKAGQAPVIDFSMKDYRSTRQRVENALQPETDEVRLDVQMQSDTDTLKVSVSGQVSGPTGEAVNGARVWLSSSELQAYVSTRSSTGGEYQFNGIEVGDAYILGVDPAEEYAAFKSDILSIGPDDLYYDVRLDVSGFSNLSGKVTDLSGKPLRNFSFWIRSIDVASHPLISVLTDGAGGFRLERIPAGAIKLETRSQPQLEASGIVLGPGESRHVEVPLDWGQDWLLGQVVDEEDEPISRAQVVLRWTRSYFDVSSQSRREVMSDQGGYFALSNLDAEDYILTVQAAGYQPYRAQYQPDQGGQEVLIRLSRQVSIVQALNEGG